MPKYNITGRPLPNSPRDQFLIHLYGYLAQNGCAELAKALAKEARFAANHYPLLDYFDEWWSLMWPVFQETVNLEGTNNLAINNEFFGLPLSEGNYGTNRSFKTPMPVRDQEGAGLQSMLQQQALYMRQLNQQQAARFNSVSHLLQLDQVPEASSPYNNDQLLNQHDERLRAQGQYNSQIRVQQQLEFQAQQQQFLNQQKLLQQQQRQQLQLQNHHQQVLQAGRQQQNGRQLDGVTPPNQASQSLPVNGDANANSRLASRQRKSSKSSSKVTKNKSNQPNRVHRKPSQTMKIKRLAQLPSDAAVGDTPNSETNDQNPSGPKLCSPLPVLIPGHAPVVVRRDSKSTSAKPQLNSRKSITSYATSSPLQLLKQVNADDIATQSTQNHNMDTLPNTFLGNRGSQSHSTSLVRPIMNSASSLGNVSSFGSTDLLTDFPHTNVQNYFPSHLFQDHNESSSALGTALTSNSDSYNGQNASHYNMNADLIDFEALGTQSNAQSMLDQMSLSDSLNGAYVGNLGDNTF